MPIAPIARGAGDAGCGAKKTSAQLALEALSSAGVLSSPEVLSSLRAADGAAAGSAAGGSAARGRANVGLLARARWQSLPEDEKAKRIEAMTLGKQRAAAAAAATAAVAGVGAAAGTAAGAAAGAASGAAAGAAAAAGAGTAAPPKGKRARD
jgi:hypothetical protein